VHEFVERYYDIVKNDLDTVKRTRMEQGLPAPVLDSDAESDSDSDIEYEADLGTDLEP